VPLYLSLVCGGGDGAGAAAGGAAAAAGWLLASAPEPMHCLEEAFSATFS
jgi:hypothetical protein